MKCLSLWQPWASLLFAPDEWRKRVETRSWKTVHRGLLVIHAAKRWDRLQKEAIRESPLLQQAWAATVAEIGHPVLGAYIGVVRLDHIQPTDKFAPSELERALGNFASDRYAWLLRHAIAFEQPIRGKGCMSVFDAPADVHEQLAAAIAAVGVS